jgi:hypothetical protein
MVTPWITGKEIMDVHGIAAAELGKACYDGILTAYLPDVPREVYELSKVQRVPKYPPPGIDPLNYIQPGEKVRWDWEFILGVKPLKILLLQTEHSLGACYAVLKYKRDKVNRESSLWLHEYGIMPPIGLRNIPRYTEDDDDVKTHHADRSGIRIIPRSNKYDNPFSKLGIDELVEMNRKLEQSRFELSQQICKLSEPNFEALCIVQAQADECGISDSYTYAREHAFTVFMSTQYSYLIDGEIKDELSIKGRLFHFDFDMFHRVYDGLAKLKYGDGYSCPLGHVIAQYKAELSQFWFNRVAVETWRGVSLSAGSSEQAATAPVSTEETIQAEPQGGTSGKATFNIPPSLWAGKSLEAAIAALRKEGFSNEVIAYVLVEKMGTAKLPVGRLLFPPKRGGDVKEDSSYTRNIETALNAVKGRYDITFMG